MTAPQMPPPRTVEISVLHDARAVHDCSNIQFLQFVVNGRPLWVVAQITPGAQSGSATVPGAYIQAETGQLVTPKGSQTVIIKEGKWTLLASGQRTEASGGTYSWTEPPVKKRLLAPEDHYSPFVSSRTIVFRHQPTADGISQFESVALIFPDWAEHVGPPFAYFGGHPELLETGKAHGAVLAQWKQLLSNENKLLAAAAFRELIASGHITAEMAHQNLTHANAPLDAIFFDLLLTSSTPIEVAQGVESVIKGSRDVAKLRSVALAAFSAMLC